MTTLYPKVSIPKPFDQNRNAIVMELAKGSLLSKTRLLDPEWYLDEILRRAKITYSMGIIHADLSEYNVFVSEDGVQLIDWPQYITPEHPQADEILERDVLNILTHFYRKYGIKRELNETVSEIKSGAEKSAEDKIGDPDNRSEGGTVEKGAFKEEGLEEYSPEDEDFEAKYSEAENVEAEDFEAEEFEAEEFEEDIEAENIEAEKMGTIVSNPVKRSWQVATSQQKLPDSRSLK